MKKILTLALLFSLFAGMAQNNNQAINKSGSAAKSKLGSATVNSIPYPLKHDTCLDKEFSIMFYVVLDSVGSTGPATPAALNLMLANINSAFERICVKFVNCSTVYIPTHPFNQWDRSATQPIITAQWYTESTINMYFPDSVINNVNSEPGGYTFSLVPSSAASTAYSMPVKDLVVVNKGRIINNSASVIHLLGEFFGLPHTHGEINPGNPASPPPPVGVASHEFVNGTNCSSGVTAIPHGDGFCDTEADPGQNAAISDGLGQLYIRPYDNYMSFYSKRCRFTQEQYNQLAYKILTQRLYLH